MPLANSQSHFADYEIQFARLVYRVTKGDGSGYNRTVQTTDTKSKVGGAITNGEYHSQE